MDLSALPGFPSVSQADIAAVLPECMPEPAGMGVQDEEDFAAPSPLLPSPAPVSRSSRILVQTVRSADVGREAQLRAEGGLCFNTCNAWEWAPFRPSGAGAIRADSAWWASLPPEQRAEIAGVAEVSAAGSVEVPHESEISKSPPCRRVYDSYKKTFEFAYWRTLKPRSELVPLRRRDRRVLAAVALRRLFGGEGLGPEDLEELSSALLSGLAAAIARAGGRAFVKTPSKSAKNDVAVRPHTQPESILDELTSSKEVLLHSLGSRLSPARYLVVQPWEDGITEACEFRVIIVNRHVAGISQQAWFKALGHSRDSAQSAAQRLLHLWYAKLQHACPYSDCVLDAYVAGTEAHLIEVNPCGWWGSSGSGLFHWARDRDVLLDPGAVPVRVVVEGPDEAAVSVDFRQWEDW